MVDSENINHISKHQKFIDKLIYVVAIIMPLMTIPQVYNVWVLQEVAGVSLLTWGMFTVFSFIWLWYAIEHKNYPLLVNNILWISLQGAVAIGIILFGSNVY